MAQKLFAEFFGTLVLVLFGCGAAVLGGFAHIGQVGIALSFGFTLAALIYGLGPVSGCHVNPAVSLAALVAGRMSPRDMIAYWVVQFAGALAGAAILTAIAGGTGAGLGANGFDTASPGGFQLGSAAVFETVATAIFVVVILGVTGKDGQGAFAGLAIGLALAAIHIVGIQITGVSVNPARSFGPAVLLGGLPLKQLWLFILAPAVGAVLGATAFRWKLLET
ncbi:MAG: aquaporin [Pseudomonadota bacterium]|jgi:aquaporin Z